MCVYIYNDYIIYKFYCLLWYDGLKNIIRIK